MYLQIFFFKIFIDQQQLTCLERQVVNIVYIYFYTNDHLFKSKLNIEKKIQRCFDVS